jgi:hypothetical protein
MGAIVTFREAGNLRHSSELNPLRWGAPSIIITGWVMGNLYLWITIASTVLLINVVAFTLFLR